MGYEVTVTCDGPGCEEATITEEGIILVGGPHLGMIPGPIPPKFPWRRVASQNERGGGLDLLYFHDMSCEYRWLVQHLHTEELLMERG